MSRAVKKIKVPAALKAKPPLPAEPRPTPLLNEHALIQALGPDTPITPDGMRAVTLLCMHACYDRKVKREFFVDMLDHAMDVFTALRDWEEGMLINGMHLPPLPRIAPVIKNLRHYLATQMTLVAKCPTAADKVS